MQVLKRLEIETKFKKKKNLKILFLENTQNCLYYLVPISPVVVPKKVILNAF